CESVACHADGAQRRASCPRAGAPPRPSSSVGTSLQIGRAHVCTPVTQRSPLFPYTTLFRSDASLWRVTQMEPSDVRRARAPEHPRDLRPASERASRSEEHTSALQSHRDLHSFPTRRSSDLMRVCGVSRRWSPATCVVPARRSTPATFVQRRNEPPDRKSTRLHSSHTEISTLSLHDALPI